MEVQELRTIYERFFKCETVQVCIDFLNIHLDYFVQVIGSEDSVNNQSLFDAKLVNQMIFTKIAYLKKSLEGINYSSEFGKLNTIIDPTIIASLIRNMYETIAMFSVVYIQPKTDDEKLILYNLWVHAGLSFRQRFETEATAQENKDKCKEELKIIRELKTEIEKTTLYKSLTEYNKQKIQRKLKEKDYKIRFDKNNNVVNLSWQEISDYFDPERKLLGNIYTYLSLCAHPSNVSVFQFADMFKETSRASEELTIFNLKTAFILLSIFIADYIQLFPKVLKTYETLPIEQQIVLNSWNKLARGDTKSINAAWENLE